MPSSRLLFGLIPWYSLLVVSGMAVAVFLSYLEERRMGLPKDTCLDLALRIIPFGVLGARLYYVLFSLDEYAADPLGVFRIWEGGLAIYGGVIAGFLTIVIFARKKRIPLPTLLDMAAPGLVLAQAIGRWGNFFNMEAYGVEITSPAWQFFPAGVLIDGHWHMATFFYESTLDLCVFCWLWRWRKHRTHPGDTVLAYFLLYGAARAVIEGFREDSLYLLPGLRVSQLLSILLCFAVCIVWTARNPYKRRFWLLLPSAALDAVLIVHLTGMGLGARTLSLVLYGAACIACVLILSRTGGALCHQES